MTKAGARALFDLVESFFTKYLPQQRGASPHTIRAYRDALKLLLVFTSERCGCEIANLQLKHLNADIVAGFLDHIEAARSNSATTRVGGPPSEDSSSISSATTWSTRCNIPEYWRSQRRRRANDPQPILKLPMCGRSSPTQIDAPRTVGATTRFSCSFTTVALGSARRSACDGLICS